MFFPSYLFLYWQIWYSNVPHTKLAEVKGHQNWVKVTGEHLTFPGGGTQFVHGALHYIDVIQEVSLYTFLSSWTNFSGLQLLLYLFICDAY